MRPYFVHIRPQNVPVNCKGGKTIAIVGDEDNGFAYGVAHCSRKDNYSKAKGRVLAVGRAFEKSTRIHLADDVRSVKEAEALVRAVFTAV